MKKLIFLPPFLWILLSIFFTPLGLAAPNNDNLATAINITNLPYTHQQSTQDADNEPAELLSKCFEDFTTKFDSASVWYQYTATRNQMVTFDTLGSDYDTLLSIWQGNHHPLTEIDCNDDNGSQIQSHLNLSLKKDTTYYINISGFRGANGNLTLNAKFVNSLLNDNLADAIEITSDANFSYSNAQNTKEAINESNEQVSRCGSDSQGSVWYQYTATDNQLVVFDTVSSDYNTILSVWTGSQHPLTEMACDDGNGGPESRVSVEFSKGTTYYISVATGKVGGMSLLPQTGLLVFNLTSPPANDNIANAILIEDPLPYINTQNTGGATLENGELSPSCSPEANASVWYLYSPTTAHNNLIFSTVGSSYDTVLSLWQGTNHPLTELACNNDVTVLTEHATQLGSASQISWPMKENETIHIEVSSASGDTGNLILRVEEGKRDFTITFYPSPSIASCQKATLNVDLSTIEGAIEMSQPLSYQWYQGDSSNESTPVGTDSDILTTPPLEKNTNYWVRITNPTGTLDSETMTVTVNKSTQINGIGINAFGHEIPNQVTFTGQLTKLETGITGNNLRLRQTDEVSIAFTIAVDPNHVSEPAEIIMVAHYITEISNYFFMRDANLWQLWESGIMSDLTAAQANTPLQNCIDATVYEGVLENLPGDFTVYIGYRLINTGEIFYNSQTINFTVE